MILVLDLDRTLNRLYPPWARSIRDLVPPPLARRGHYEMWDWITSHLAAHEYPVHDVAVSVVRALSTRASSVIVNTGRPETVWNATDEWLRSYFRIDQLLMRAEGDFRRTVDVKREHFIGDILPSYPGELVCAFDDNSQAVGMYRQYGAIALLAPQCWTTIASAVGDRDIITLLRKLQSPDSADDRRSTGKNYLPTRD